MYQVKIQILQTKIFKSSLASWPHVFRTVISVPQLGCDEKIFSFNNTFFYSFFNSFSYFNLVTIGRGAVDQTVPIFNSVKYNILTLLFGNFPSPESNLWYLIAIIKGLHKILVFFKVIFHETYKNFSEFIRSLIWTVHVFNILMVQN